MAYTPRIERHSLDHFCFTIIYYIIIYSSYAYRVLFYIHIRNIPIIIRRSFIRAIRLSCYTAADDDDDDDLSWIDDTMCVDR